MLVSKSRLRQLYTGKPHPICMMSFTWMKVMIVLNLKYVIVHSLNIITPRIEKW